MSKKVDTNIKVEHREAFNAITSGRYTNFALLSCFCDGEPTCAIVAIHDSLDKEDEVLITPLFVAITDKMVLTDHEGVEPSGGGLWDWAKKKKGD